MRDFNLSAEIAVSMEDGTTGEHTLESCTENVQADVKSRRCTGCGAAKVKGPDLDFSAPNVYVNAAMQSRTSLAGTSNTLVCLGNVVTNCIGNDPPLHSSER